MAWVRVHDAALTHPKLTGLVKLTNPFALWIWGLSYCQTHLTDGLIPKDAVPRTAKSAVDVLMKRRLWELHGEGYEVHDYLEWNDARTLVMKKRGDARERMKNARDRSSRELLRGVGYKNKEVQEEKKEIQEKRNGAQGSGAFGAGGLPRDHLRHSMCGRVCLHETQFAQIVGKVGGERLAAELAVSRWAADVLAEWGRPPKFDVPISGTNFQFWDARYEEWKGPAVKIHPEDAMWDAIGRAGPSVRP